MTAWTSVHDILDRVSDAEVLELDRYIGDDPSESLNRSERANYTSGAWLAPGRFATPKRRSGRHQGDAR